MKLLLTGLLFAFSLASYAQVAPSHRTLIGNDTLLAKTNSTVEQLSKKRKKTVLEIVGKVGTNPLIVIDGKTFKGVSDTIDTDKIERLEVLKGDDAQKIYGKEAKDGVILISLIPHIDTVIEPKPLILVNDTVRSMAGINNINPNDVAWVDVVKNAEEIAPYGTAGANGIVKIYMKDHVRRANQEKLCRISETYNQYMRTHPHKEIICMINGAVVKDGSELYKLTVSNIKQTDFKISETTPSINIITKL